jgi:hypothetical protein
MADQHRATAGEWASVKARASGGVAYSTILELLHRIEALERDRRAILDSSSRLRVGLHDSPAKPNHPAKPDNSLVDQVEDALDMARGDSEAKARAAIRAVAAWMTSNPDHHFPPALVFALDKEAEHRST